MKKVIFVSITALCCFAPTCNSPTASGEITSYLQTDSSIVISGSLQLNAGISISAEAQKLINGEWATIGGVQIQVPHDTTLKANVKLNFNTKPKTNGN